MGTRSPKYVTIEEQEAEYLMDDAIFQNIPPTPPTPYALRGQAPATPATPVELIQARQAKAVRSKYGWEHSTDLNGRPLICEKAQVAGLKPQPSEESKEYAALPMQQEVRQGPALRRRVPATPTKEDEMRQRQKELMIRKPIIVLPESFKTSSSGLRIYKRQDGDGSNIL